MGGGVLRAGAGVGCPATEVWDEHGDQGTQGKEHSPVPVPLAVAVPGSMAAHLLRGVKHTFLSSSLCGCSPGFSPWGCFSTESSHGSVLLRLWRGSGITSKI